VTRPMPKGARLATVLVLVAAVAWLGFRATRAFDHDRHAADAAAVLAAPDAVSHLLPPVPNGRGSPQPSVPNGRGSPQPSGAGAPEREGSPQPGGASAVVHNSGASGRLFYRPGVWLSVVDLRGLDPVGGNERYLVFLRNWAGWTLAGAARPGADGTAQVRSAAEPRPPTIYEVVVTVAVDDATSVPHGQPVLHWFDASLAPPRARQFDFARGA
jgi:hypothetical protein